MMFVSNQKYDEYDELANDLSDGLCQIVSEFVEKYREDEHEEDKLFDVVEMAVGTFLAKHVFLTIKDGHDKYLPEFTSRVGRLVEVIKEIERRETHEKAKNH